MNSLSNELRAVIAGRIQSATPDQVLAIAASLCASEPRLDSVRTSALEVKPRFTAGAEIVHDNLTGLEWTRANVPGGRMKWSDAKTAAAGVRLSGYTDWRLPTIRELLSIVDYERASPAIDTDTFQCDAAWYWSSTLYKPSPGDCAWLVLFGSGLSSAHDRDDSGFVRAVRAGQLVEPWY